MSNEAPEKILLIATHGPEHPERASFPFMMANAALVLDVEATIALQGVAVLLAQKGIAEHVFAAGLPPLKELMDNFTAQGGKLLVCTPCVNERKMTEDMLIEGAELVAGARVVMDSIEANAVLTY
ncbi:MAG: DsrE family protein [Planctomycetota bacterium]